VTSAILEVSDVSWGPRGRPPILSDVSLTLPEGQRLAICGPNGAGKSSLLRLLYRYHAPTAGTVCLAGRDLWLMSAREAARIVAAVLQEQPAEFALTGRQIVTLGRLPHRSRFSGAGLRDERVIEDAIRTMDLERLIDRPFRSLSGGERQRVMLARALAQEPRLLILDEPTNHLDIRHRIELLELLRELPLTVVTTLHDLELAARYADRVLVLHEGRVVADGRPADALDEATIARVFEVEARIDHAGPSPRFTFHRRKPQET